jgi:diguanylate cyclase (GGDEF)-like protein
MALVHVVQQLSFARDLGTFQEIVRHAARSLTGADGASFVLDENGMCYYADEEAIAPLWKGLRFPKEICISGWSMLNRQAAVIPDVFADPRVPAEAYRPTFVRSLAMVPIRSLDPIGAIGTYWASHHEATAEEVQLLQALADTTAVAMENVRIYGELEQRVRERTQELEAANEAIRELSLHDELTGLYNRRGFNLMAEQNRKASRRAGADQFVACFDADSLKQVNDTHGHRRGDELLKGLASVLEATFRETDVIARMGGDEFLVLGTLTTNGDAVLRRFESACAEFNAQSAARGFELKVSCGIAMWPASSDMTLDQVIHQADESMYLAKRAARQDTSVLQGEAFTGPASRVTSLIRRDVQKPRRDPHA